MAEMRRNGLSLWRWNRWFRVRVIYRYKMRNFWPSPGDIDRMSTDEREAWFTSIGLDEQIAAAKADYLRETTEDGAQSPARVGQRAPVRGHSTRA